METIDYSKYKYYKGEINCPEQFNDDERGKFWHGEKMFSRTVQSQNEWIKYAKITLGNLHESDRAKYNIASKYTEEQFAIILYIEDLFTKWCPYDDMLWIYKY